jgi:hypothetical protein
MEETFHELTDIMKERWTGIVIFLPAIRAKIIVFRVYTEIKATVIAMAAF